MLHLVPTLFPPCSHLVPTLFTQVLTGEDALVHPLWAKTRDPLRAALLASKCCQRLSGLPHLRSDEKQLKMLAVEYEDWAIGLLDAVDEPDAALPLLAMVPSVGFGQSLWPHSCIELAVDFGGNSAPCRRFVAHRHSQYLLEAFFAGDYPNSHARIPIDARLYMIALQCLFFFLPGTFCEVMPVNAAVMERHRHGEADGDRTARHAGIESRGSLLAARAALAPRCSRSCGLCGSLLVRLAACAARCCS